MRNANNKSTKPKKVVTNIKTNMTKQLSYIMKYDI